VLLYVFRRVTCINLQPEDESEPLFSENLNANQLKEYLLEVITMVKHSSS